MLEFEFVTINRERPTRILIQLLVLEEVGSLSQRAGGEWMAQNRKQGTNHNLAARMEGIRKHQRASCL